MQAIVTPSTIRDYLIAQMEPAEPVTSIRAYLATREGKRLTKRDLPKLREIDPTIRFHQIADMFLIVWGEYENSGGREGGSVLIAYTRAPCPVVKMAEFDHRCNVAYFGARESRNASRTAALANPEALATLAHAINRINEAREEIRTLTEYGAVLCEAAHAPFIPRFER